MAKRRHRSPSRRRRAFSTASAATGGGVVNFIMEIENLTYGDAVRFLAKRAGLEVPDDGAYQSQYKKKKNGSWHCAARRHSSITPSSKPRQGEEARAYLQKRGVSGQTVTRFGLGYSPNRWTALLDVMTAKGYTKEELLEAGLPQPEPRQGDAL